ncbi:MAG: hypothetical protein ACE5K9_06240 [Candidatus Methylomirabilales bacterium]
MRKAWKGALMLCLVVSLLFSSGCGALLLLGAGGAGGYMIRKGEEGEQQESSESRSPSKQRLALHSEGSAGQQLVLRGGSR